MTDRRSLREFQARLSERLRAGAGAGHAARLGVQVGPRRLLVDLSEAGEIASAADAVAPVPMTHDWFRGLANLRGALYGVSDLARFDGGDPTPGTRETRLVAFAARLNLNAAIVVDRMLGLQNVDAMSAQEPADRESRRPWLGRDLVDASGQRWTELSLERLAVDERFLAVNR